MQGYLDALHHSPFGMWRSVARDPFHCCETNTRIPFHSGTRNLEIDTAKTLNAALGTNLNSVPTMLHRGPRAECTFKGTHLDLHKLFCSKKTPHKTKNQNSKKPTCKSVITFIAALTPSPAKTSRYVEQLYFKVRDVLQVFPTPHLSQGLDICAPHSPLPKTGKLNHPSCHIYCAP